MRRVDNEEADGLGKAAAGQRAIPRDVFHDILKESSVARLMVPAKMLVLGHEDWCTPIQAYLDGRSDTGDRSEDQRVRLRARGYNLVEGVLYKYGFVSRP